MKKHLILVLLINLSVVIYGQEKTAYGVVNNLRTKAPIQNALVKVAETDRQVYTDSLGNFKIDVPKGNQHLLVSHDKFDSKKVYLKAPYWKRPLTIGLIDSIWKINDVSKKKIVIMTSEYEFSNCYNTRGQKISVDKQYQVLFILTKNGDKIEFNKKNPGRIIDTGVFGYPQIYLPFGEIDSTVFNKNALESIWENGIKYQFIAQDSSGYLCYQPEEINIPLSDIEMLKLKEQNNNKKIGISMIVVGGMAGVAGIIIISYVFAHMFDG